MVFGIWYVNVIFVRVRMSLTHWDRMTYICVSKLTIIGSDNGLSPGRRRQAIIWTNAEILLIRHLGTNSSEILIGIQTFSFKKMHLKMSSAKWRPFCLGLNVLIRDGAKSPFICQKSFSMDSYQDKPHHMSLPITKRWHSVCDKVMVV